MQLVHSVVLDLQAECVGDVDGLDDLAGLVDQSHGEVAHLADRLVQLFGHSDVGVATAGALSDVLGEVAHALKGGADAQRTDECPQLTSHGGLEGDDIQSQHL